MHLRLSARQGREVLLAGQDEEKTNMGLKQDSNIKSLLENTLYSKSNMIYSLLLVMDNGET